MQPKLELFQQASRIREPSKMPSPERQLEIARETFPHLSFPEPPAARERHSPFLRLAISIEQLWRTIVLPPGIRHKKAYVGSFEGHIRKLTGATVERAEQSTWVSLDFQHEHGQLPGALQANEAIRPHLAGQSILSAMVFAPDWINEWPPTSGLRLCGLEARLGDPWSCTPYVMVKHRGIEKDLCLEAYISGSFTPPGSVAPLVYEYWLESSLHRRSECRYDYSERRNYLQAKHSIILI